MSPDLHLEALRSYPTLSAWLVSPTKVIRTYGGDYIYSSMGHIIFVTDVPAEGNPNLFDIRSFHSICHGVLSVQETVCHRCRRHSRQCQDSRAFQSVGLPHYDPFSTVSNRKINDDLARHIFRVPKACPSAQRSRGQSCHILISRLEALRVLAPLEYTRQAESRDARYEKPDVRWQNSRNGSNSSVRTLIIAYLAGREKLRQLRWG